MLAFLPPEIIGKPVVFLNFQGEYKENIGRQYIKVFELELSCYWPVYLTIFTNSLKHTQTPNLLKPLIVDFVNKNVPYCLLKLIV